jgi:Na+-translocating ferredoxin:NAD+ oxidoreductase RnfC subunit
MGIVDQIRDAGVVGAGGAGFPTHIKISGKADIVLANGAECEPLLRTDRHMMEKYPVRITAGLKFVMQAVGASKGVICVKKKNQKAIEELARVIAHEPDISIFTMDNYYPAGDEQQIVYEVTGKVVPTGGIPLDVGAVVANVSTLMNVADALEGKPATDKYVTVGGEVERPITIKVPIGTPVSELIKVAGGPDKIDGCTLIIGGPATGKICTEWNEPVQKTTGGVLIFKSNHPLIHRKIKDTGIDFKLMKTVCCQCSICTQLCPRNALGLKVEPHKVMRTILTGEPKLLGGANGIFSCCDCGLCSYYACNFGLNPSRIMTRMKSGLISSGVKPEKQVGGSVAPNKDSIKVPVKRLMARMGILKYDADTALIEEVPDVREVCLPLRMHIGAQSLPIVREGDVVAKGQLIADIPEEGLGAKVHASISGQVAKINSQSITIKAV